MSCQRKTKSVSRTCPRTPTLNMFINTLFSGETTAERINSVFCIFDVKIRVLLPYFVYLFDPSTNNSFFKSNLLVLHKRHSHAVSGEFPPFSCCKKGACRGTYFHSFLLCGIHNTRMIASS